MKLALADIQSACGHHNPTDALFLQGYAMLVELNLTDTRILEVACGHGDLAAWLRRFTEAEIVAIDIEEANISAARQKHGHLPNLSFICADALNLGEFPDHSFDLVVGQAAMHHLAHNLPKASQEFSRILKPGGRLVFIYEPLGHNPVIASARSMLATRRQLIDESNLFEWALQRFAANYSHYEVYYFSLFAYICKALPAKSIFARWCSKWFARLDGRLFRRFPQIRKYAANFNVCYWK